MSTGYVPYPDGMRKTWPLGPKAKRQREDSPPEAPPTKELHEEIPSEPVHGQRPVLKVELNWKIRNHTDQCHGTFILDTGCTCSILSVEFVRKEKITVVCQPSHIQMQDAQGDIMTGVGEYITVP